MAPELHSKSPWLLWWEKHEDSENINKWHSRIKEIIELKPDFICTDYINLIN